MNENYCSSPQFVFDLTIGILFVLGVALILVLTFDLVNDKGGRK